MVIHLFGERLKNLRKDRNIKQEELGELCGVAKNTISNWENNITQPPLETLKTIAKFFGVTTDYLLGFNEEDTNNIEKLRSVLTETGMMKSDDELEEEEIRLAIEQAKQYKQMWKRVNDLPNKYPEGSVKIEQHQKQADTKNNN